MNFLELAKRSYYVGYTEFTITCFTDSVQELFHGVPPRGQHVVPPDREQLCDSGGFECFDVFHFFQHLSTFADLNDLLPRVVIQLVLEEVVNQSMAQHSRMRFTQVSHFSSLEHTPDFMKRDCSD